MFFINILKDLVLGGFVQRRKNGAIMIRVRGTEESLCGVQYILDNANVEGVSWTLNTRLRRKLIEQSTSHVIAITWCRERRAFARNIHCILSEVQYFHAR